MPYTLSGEILIYLLFSFIELKPVREQQDLYLKANTRFTRDDHNVNHPETSRVPRGYQRGIKKSKRMVCGKEVRKEQLNGTLLRETLIILKRRSERAI
jgi:hypothetical protein